MRIAKAANRSFKENDMSTLVARDFFVRCTLLGSHGGGMELRVCVTFSPTLSLSFS